MNTTLPNNRAKYGAKIFRCYQVITFYVLSHFLAAPCILDCNCHPNNNEKNKNKMSSDMGSVPDLKTNKEALHESRRTSL